MASTTKTMTVTMQLRKEAAYTSLRVRERGISEGKLNEGAKMVSLIAYALDSLAEYQARESKVVDFPAVMALAPRDLGIPDWYVCQGIRYSTSIRFTPAVLEKLDSWIAGPLSRQFTELRFRVPYRNAAIAGCLFRFVCLLDEDAASVPVLQQGAGEALDEAIAWTESMLAGRRPGPAGE